MEIEDQMRQILREFLTEWLKWAETEAPVHIPPFNPRLGLCASYAVWMHTKKFSEHNMRRLFVELSNMLKSQFENFAYPFGGKERFYKDESHGVMHMNHMRLAWTRQTIENLSRGKDVE